MFDSNINNRNNIEYTSNDTIKNKTKINSNITSKIDSDNDITSNKLIRRTLLLFSGILCIMGDPAMTVSSPKLETIYHLSSIDNTISINIISNIDTDSSSYIASDTKFIIVVSHFDNRRF